MILWMWLACIQNPLPATEFGNPERGLGVGYSVVETEPPPLGATIRHAWVGLGETKLILEEREADEHELEWETPEVVTDLAKDPVALRFRSPNAGYDRIELRPKDGRDGPANAPAALEDASFVIEGERADGVPFRLLSTTEEDIVLAGGFDLAGDQRELALGFDLSSWLEVLDLDSAEVSGGSIRIDDGNNRALLDRWEDELPASVTLAEDADGDGRVGPDDPVLAGR